MARLVAALVTIRQQLEGGFDIGVMPAEVA